MYLHSINVSSLIVQTIFIAIMYNFSPDIFYKKVFKKKTILKVN